MPRAQAAASAAGAQNAARGEAESTYAWMRLLASLAISSIGGVGMWSVAVVLPAVQAEFGIARSAASLPYTLTMLGFGFGGILMGKLSDRFGIVVPVVVGAFALALGFYAAGAATSLWQFALVQGLLIGLLGASATFSPLLADISLWFVRRRGLAVAIAASGNYLAGTIWPPVVQHFVETVGWRQTHVGIGIFCAAFMLPLALVLRRRPPAFELSPAAARAVSGSARPLGFSPGQLQGLLIVAGLTCCMAMSMPQVHIVAYCADLGYGPARGAEMLAVMLGFGVVSRLASGWICDHIGGLRTLALGSALQCLALVLFLPFDGLVSLYVISALFGLFQGGIVPAYAIIVREHFTPREAGTRIAAVITATLFGMALGGWMTGAIFDLTGSYTAAFANGIGWNIVNLAIALWLLHRSGGGWLPRMTAPAPRAG
jgi:MFS family permease